MRLDPRIETIVDALLARANKTDMEVTADNTFDDERKSVSVLIHNMSTNSLGIIATDVEEFEDTDPVIFLIFNGKLYDYCKAEGFNRESMVTNFKNQVLKKVGQRQFFDFILNENDK
jgi:hypothetical protein